MNNFEKHADKFQKTYRKVSRPSWQHTTQTYQGNGTTDWFLVSCTAFIVGLGIIGLITLL